MVRSTFSFFTFLASVCLVLGCGGGKGSSGLELKGKVTVGGKPGQNLNVQLSSSDGQTYTGTTGEDGSFVITGVKPGEMSVTISGGAGGSAAGGPGGNMQMDAKTKEKMKEMMKEMKGKDAMPPTAPPATKIAAKYADKAKSGLTWSVSAAQTTKDFELTE